MVTLLGGGARQCLRYYNFWDGDGWRFPSFKSENGTSTGQKAYWGPVAPESGSADVPGVDWAARPTFTSIWGGYVAEKICVW